MGLKETFFSYISLASYVIVPFFIFLVLPYVASRIWDVSFFLFVVLLIIASKFFTVMIFLIVMTKDYFNSK